MYICLINSACLNNNICSLSDETVNERYRSYNSSLLLSDMFVVFCLKRCSLLGLCINFDAENTVYGLCRLYWLFITISSTSSAISALQFFSSSLNTFCLYVLYYATICLDFLVISSILLHFRCSYSFFSWIWQLHTLILLSHAASLLFNWALLISSCEFALLRSFDFAINSSIVLVRCCSLTRISDS